MSEPFIAEVRMFGGNFAPVGWALCQGQLLAISANDALFSILGTTYGGDGRTTFGLPDLRGRAPIHAGTGPGLTPQPLGQRAGSENSYIGVAQMPAHTHSATLHGENAGAEGTLPAGNMLGRSGSDSIYAAPTDTRNDVAMAAQSIVQHNVGGGQPVNNVQPFLTVNYIIALVGIYPSRN